MDFFKNLVKFFISKQFLISLGLLTMTYFIVVIGTIYYLDNKTNHGEKIEVPDYLGKNIKEVVSELDALHLSYEVVDSIYDPSQAEGTIIYQDPSPSKLSEVYVKDGRKIRFRVSKKTKLIEIPIVVDRSERYATSVLKNMGIKAVVTYQFSLEAAGAVLSQKYKNKDMVEGDKVPVGATVYITVGKGYSNEEILVPNLSCLTISQVKSRLGRYPVSVFENYVNCYTKEDSLNAKVISQNPPFEEDAILHSGSGISVTLDADGCN